MHRKNKNKNNKMSLDSLEFMLTDQETKIKDIKSIFERYQKTNIERHTSEKKKEAWGQIAAI